MDQTHVNELCTVMDLPSFHPQIFKRHERIIGRVIECVAKESSSEAVSIERAMTQESINELRKVL